MITVIEPKLATAVAVLSLGAWIYLAIARGGFWRFAVLTDEAPPLPVAAEHRRVAVVIPARNEGHVIAAAVQSLLAQNYEGPLRIVVVDDNSADNTAQAASIGNRVTVVSGSSLPSGWTGKMWAVAQGVREAEQFHPDYFLLTDADIVHGAANLRSLIARAETANLDLASVMVRLHCRSLPERLLIPAFVFFFFKLYPPAWIANGRDHTAGAAGGCMLIRVDR